jgi:FAD/FMN-containing dehydrogenase
MTRIDRRKTLSLLGATAAMASAPRPLGAQVTTQLPTQPLNRARVVLNDASRLSATPVNRHWIVKPNDSVDLIASLRAELKVAAGDKRPVSVSAARHSMGGQSLPRNGTAITLALNSIEPDTKAKTYQTHAGTRWSQIIGALDKIGHSPAVMQSNNDFAVASTFSVNAHGWPVPYGPFGATVRKIDMMLADGTIVTCSRTENAELFKLAMGGYGLFGIILKLDVDMVENALLKPTYDAMSYTVFAPRFIAAANDPAVRMLYGRLSVARQGFFESALLISYRNTAGPLTPATAGGFATGLSNKIYRAQVGSEAAKRARWFAETVAGPRTSSGIATRNSLMNEPVSNLPNTDRRRTDILHEYFVPADKFVDFVKLCRELIPKSGQELINITLRYVAADQTSVMAFAPTARIAGVMSFSQQMTPEADASMLVLTEALIERIGALGGSFYLPYRLHARPDQVRKIYTNTDQFVARKRHYDPGLVFQNAMWQAYFSGL